MQVLGHHHLAQGRALRGLRALALAWAWTAVLLAPRALAAEAPRKLQVNEYRVEGAEQLTTGELEVVLAPFLGPGRELADIESARAAVEKAYSDRGFQTVTVAIPRQTVRDGVVVLKVTEGRVGRLRVNGARWYSPRDIKLQAQSVAEGTVPNFEALVSDIVVLNGLPDRRVTPAVRSGALPGTVDVDLNVQDAPPLHGSLEWNNRHGASTTAQRLNGALRYDNLWQLGHSLNFAFQVAPQRVADGKVFSASYLARIPDVPWLTFSANGVLQDSDVSTLGAVDVKGRGRTLGGRANFTLPGTTRFFQSISTGLDCKRYEEALSLGAETMRTPIEHWPWTTRYGVAWAGDASQTQLGLSAAFNVRALSSSADQFDSRRYKASAGFMVFRLDFSRTDELPLGLQLFERVQAQFSPDPLISSEQITAGGAESVRGYLEAQASGDYGGVGTIELRGPSFAARLRPAVDDWRLFVFADGGRLGLRYPLPEQTPLYRLVSAGGGMRIGLFRKLDASLDVGVPLASGGVTTKFREPRVHFRLSSEF